MENNSPLYDWRDYLVIIIMGAIFFFAFINYIQPKPKNTIIYHPKHKNKF